MKICIEIYEKDQVFSVLFRFKIPFYMSTIILFQLLTQFRAVAFSNEHEHVHIYRFMK